MFQGERPAAAEGRIGAGGALGLVGDLGGSGDVGHALGGLGPSRTMNVQGVQSVRRRGGWGRATRWAHGRGEGPVLREAVEQGGAVVTNGDDIRADGSGAAAIVGDILQDESANGRGGS